MLKKIIAIALIIILGGTWFYLDRLNKQQIKEAEELRKSMELAHAQALARAKAAAEEKMKFEATILNDLNNCKAFAEQVNNEYLAKNHQPVRHKPGQFTVPKFVADEASKLLESANATCQSTYDIRLKNGS